MPELNQFAIVLGEHLDRLINCLGHLLVRECPIRRNHIGSDLPIALAPLLIVCFHEGLLDRSFLANRVDRAVLGNPKDPGRKLVLRIESVEGHINLHEYLLREVVGVLVAPRDAVDVIDNPLLVAPNQLGEQVAIAGKYLGHQSAVIPDLLLRHRNYVPANQKFPCDDTPAMIEISGLSKKYGTFTAVDSIDLAVRPGQVMGFLGPNGAGKTTTIRIMAGLSTPTTGRVLIDGIDITKDPARAKAITGFIPDRPFLYEKLTGRELLAFVADLYRKDWRQCSARGEELARYFELDRWLDSRIENYSHGMKQKLVLIAALLHDPTVLIIDEPMVGLDVFAQKQVKKLIRDQAIAGRTIFLTTHTLSVAEAVCDEIAILHRGRVVARGSADAIKKAAGNPGSPLEDVFLQLTEEESRGPLDP